MSPLALILILILLFGMGGSWHAGFGAGPTGGLGVVLIVLIVLLVLGKI